MDWGSLLVSKLLCPVLQIHGDPWNPELLPPRILLSLQIKCNFNYLDAPLNFYTQSPEAVMRIILPLQADRQTDRLKILLV